VGRGAPWERNAQEKSMKGRIGRRAAKQVALPQREDVAFRVKGEPGAEKVAAQKENLQVD